MYILTPEQAELSFWLLVNQVRRPDGSRFAVSSLVAIYKHLTNFLLLGCQEPAKYAILKQRVENISERLRQQQQQGIEGFSDVTDNTGNFSTSIGNSSVTPISRELEKTLWDTGVFSLETAEGLSYAAFFYLCKTFR